MRNTPIIRLLLFTVAPPPLPVYAQPVCPGDGYIWTPGYWGYGADGYFWVPGTWVIAPRIGFLWTPGYWGWGDGGYFWHAGYFFYNRGVSNVDIHNVHNVYNRTVVNNREVNRVSFNGGCFFDDAATTE